MIKRLPLIWLFIFLVIYSLSWHFSLLGFSPFPMMENRQYVTQLLLLYPSLYFVASVPFLIVFLKFPESFTLKAIVVLLFILGLTIRVLDWNIVYYYGSHIDALFWENAFYSDGLGMFLTKVTILLAPTSMILIAVFIYLINLVQDHYVHWLKNGKTVREYLFKQYLLPFSLLLGYSLLIATFFVQPSFSSNVSSPVYTDSLPEKRFLKSIKDYYFEDKIEKIILGEEEKRKLSEIGIKLESISKEYPLMKSSIYIDEDRRVRPLNLHPNIIIVFFESLSSYFIEDPEIRNYQLTANIDDFIQQSLYFDNIVNAITPTLQGQIAVLASSLHLYRSTLDLNKWSEYEDVRKQFDDREAPIITKYSMITNLLKDNAYTSVHIQSGPGSFADTENFFRLRGGYDQFYSLANEKFKPNRKLPLGKFGASDIDTFEYVKHWLSENKNSPFLLTISTINIHHPYQCETTKEGVENDILNCVYSSDVGFGIFWDYFKMSPYKDNTIVVLTADHALFPTADYLQLKQQSPSYYDYIPVAIYSPFHAELMGIRDHTLGTNLDIAPTLFELIGFDRSNAFLGLSLLSERKHFPHLIGRINLEKRFNSNNANIWRDTDQALLIRYLKSLAMHDKIFSTQ